MSAAHSTKRPRVSRRVTWPTGSLAHVGARRRRVFADRRRRAPGRARSDRSACPRSAECRATDGRTRSIGPRQSALAGHALHAGVELGVVDRLRRSFGELALHAARPAALPRALPQPAADAAGGRQRESAEVHVVVGEPRHERERRPARPGAPSRQGRAGCAAIARAAACRSPGRTATGRTPVGPASSR